MAARSRRFTEEQHFSNRYVIARNGCWLWKTQLTSRYPGFRFRGRRMPAHHVSWLIHRGEIPEGMKVCHNCPGGDNTHCVNPDHLWLGTQADNLADMGTKGRHGATRNPHEWVSSHNFGNCLPGEENPAHKLILEQVRELLALRERGWSYGRLVKRFGISKSQVARICNGKSWKDSVEGVKV